MVKRLFDVGGSALGLLVLAPVLALIALLVALDSPGPVFFRQPRVGRGGRLFRIFKFRSMRVSSPDLGPELTVGNDRRITRVGALLRRYKLDELPQLLNVILGDMSLVGPRPEVPQYVDFWDDRTRATVLSVRPGITDLASIEFRNENELLAGCEDPERKYVEEIAPVKNGMAVSYVENWSFWLDVRILFRTFAALIRQAA